MSNPNDSVADSGHTAEYLRHATAQGVGKAIDTVDRMTTPSIDAMARSLEQMRAQAGPAMHELAQSAEHLAHDGADAVRRRAARLGESSAGYVREHPLQSLLMAAGAGAALALVLRLMARPS